MYKTHNHGYATCLDILLLFSYIYNRHAPTYMYCFDVILGNNQSDDLMAAVPATPACQSQEPEII